MLITIDEAAAYLRFSKSYLYQLVSSGRLAHYTFDNAIRFKTEDLDAFADERRVPVGGRTPKPWKPKGGDDRENK